MLTIYIFNLDLSPPHTNHLYTLYFANLQLNLMLLVIHIGAAVMERKSHRGHASDVISTLFTISEKLCMCTAILVVKFRQGLFKGLSSSYEVCIL